MEIRTKYERGQKLFHLKDEPRMVWVPCAACDGRGSIRLLDNNTYGCPNCSSQLRDALGWKTGHVLQKSSFVATIVESLIEEIRIVVRSASAVSRLSGVLPQEGQWVSVNYYVRGAEKSGEYSELTLEKEYKFSLADAENARVAYEQNHMRVPQR